MIDNQKYEILLLKETSKTFKKNMLIYFTISYETNLGGWAVLYRGKSPEEVIKKVETNRGFFDDRTYRIFKHIEDRSVTAILDLKTKQRKTEQHE